MKAYAAFMRFLEEELGKMPVGHEVSYVAPAIIRVRKMDSDHWEVINVNPTVKVVSTTYLAGKHPEDE